MAANQLDWAVRLLPAALHNRPERIAPAVERLIQDLRDCYHPIVCAYADCGTSGALDQVLQAHGVDRLPGAHCYDVFAGAEVIATLMADQPGSFFLTDFLARHFDRLVWRGLGLERHPDLRDAYFRHYTRVIHLVQMPDPATAAAARAAAARLGLPLDVIATGLDQLKLGGSWRKGPPSARAATSAAT